MKTSFHWVGAGLIIVLVLLNSSPAYAATYSANLVAANSQYFTASMNTPTGNMSTCAWVKFSSMPGTGDAMTIIAKHDGGATGTGRSFDFSLGNPSGTLQLEWRNSSDGTFGNQSFAAVPFSPTVNRWYYLCAAYDTGGTVNFYEATSGSGSTNLGSVSGLKTSIFNGSNPLSVGARTDPGAYLDGNEAQVLLYGTNISSSTIDSNYCTTTPSTSSLLGYWTLDNTLVDSSGNGHTLTNNGSTAFQTDLPSCLLPPTFAAIKSSKQNVTNTSSLQDDSDLAVTLAANTSYIIDGLLFASATTTSATPDIILGLTVPSGALLAVGANDVPLMVSGQAGSRIVLPAFGPVPIHIQGTVVNGSTPGIIQLQWAQSTPNSAPTSVGAGSYLRVAKL